MKWDCQNGSLSRLLSSDLFVRANNRIFFIIIKRCYFLAEIGC